MIVLLNIISELNLPQANHNSERRKGGAMKNEKYHSGRIVTMSLLALAAFGILVCFWALPSTASNALVRATKATLPALVENAKNAPTSAAPAAAQDRRRCYTGELLSMVAAGCFVWLWFRKEK